MNPEKASSPAYRVLRPVSRWRFLNVAEVWEFRDLILTFAERDLKLRYRQTLLGVVWVVLQPLLGALALAFVFGRIARLRIDGVSYFLFVFAGFAIWTLIASAVGRGTSSLVQNASMITKVYFPRAVLPLSSILSGLVDLLVSLVVLGVFVVLDPSTRLDARVLMLPIWLLLTLCLAVGSTLLAAAWSVRYRDVQHVVPVLLQLWLYLSPVAYSSDAVPAAYRGLYFLNPLAGLLQGFRWSLGMSFLDSLGALVAAGVSICVLVIGAAVFSSLEREFADAI